MRLARERSTLSACVCWTQLLGLLADHCIEDVDDFRELEVEEMDKLKLPYLFEKHVTKLLRQLKLEVRAAGRFCG